MTRPEGVSIELLERDGCLDQLVAAWSDAMARNGRVVLVSGEAGIGKTTLVRSFLHQAPAPGTGAVGQLRRAVHAAAARPAA